MIRDEDTMEPDYQSIETVPPTIGKHTFAHCQTHYEEVHAFLIKRKSVPVGNEAEVSGITWIELFVLFDLVGDRTEEGQHQKDPDATERAEKEEETHGVPRASVEN